MFYTYVLRSKKDKQFYTGYTKNLKLRLEQHNKGLVESTKNRTPLNLVYYEACLDKDDANRREKYLKTYHGKMFIIGYCDSTGLNEKVSEVSKLLQAYMSTILNSDS